MSEPRLSSGRRLGRCIATTLHRLAARLNGSAQLKEIRLGNVLSGETCSPIGLKDFEAYLAFMEYSLENLHFIIWYQDYRRRFFDLPPEVQACSPGSKPSDFRFSTPSLALKQKRITVSETRARALSNCSVNQPSSTPLTRLPNRTRRTRRYHSSSISSMTTTLMSSPESSPSTLQSSVISSCSPVALNPFTARCSSPSPTSPSPVSLVLLDSALIPPNFNLPDKSALPFREECSHIVATFLRPGASKELTLDSRMRDAVVGDLTFNTHPDVFLPIYEEIYDVIETTSLLRFLTYAATNINWPLQVFWYVVGLITFVIGIIMAITLVVMLPISPQTNRAWRLFAVPLTSSGVMAMYSAWRGFCSHVWRRGNMQVRPWELDSSDEESAAEKAYPGPIIVSHVSEFEEKNNGEGGQNILTSRRKSVVELAEKNCGGSIGCERADEKIGNSPPSFRESTDKTAIAPFNFEFLPHESVQNSAPFDRNEGSPGLKRMPVFGPEKVILDPRISAVHKKAMRDIYACGFWFTLGFCAIILSVPSPNRDID